jgi:hypothetical protein
MKNRLEKFHRNVLTNQSKLQVRNYHLEMLLDVPNKMQRSLIKEPNK